MVKTILAFFGYVKVPKEVVQLSMEQEEFLKEVIDFFKGFYIFLEGQQTITKFLRSGRLLKGGDKDDK